MPAKKKTAKSSDLPDFEKSLSDLEQIVDDMENEDLSLEVLINRFEQGSKLLKHCHHILNSAKKRLETIQTDDLQSEDLPPESDPTQNNGEEPRPTEHDDDTRLF